MALSFDIDKIPEKLEQKASHYVALILIVLVSYQCAKLTWSFIDSKIEVVRPAIKVDPKKSRAQDSTSLNISSIVAAHIFGKKAVEKPKEPVNQEPVKAVDAPITTLNVKIHGISASDNPKWSSAILSANGKQDTYRIGDTIPGNSRAVLFQIYEDKVIIDRGGGKYETLRLSETEFSTVAVSKTEDTSSEVPEKYRNMGIDALGGKPEVVDRRSDKELSKQLSGYRNQLISAPGSLSNLMRITTVKRNGMIAGYRVRPGRDRAFFKSLGLRRNDIVTSVNGVSMSDPSTSLTLLDSLSTANEIEVTVKRGSKDMTILLGLEQ